MKRLLALGLAVGVAISSSTYVFAADSEEMSESIESLSMVDVKNNINPEINEIYYSVNQYFEKERDIRRTLNAINDFPNEYINKSTILLYLNTVNEGRTLLRNSMGKLDVIINLAVDCNLDADTIQNCITLREQISAAIAINNETVRLRKN